MKKLALALVLCLIVSILPIGVYGLEEDRPSKWAEDTISLIKKEKLLDEDFLKNFKTDMTRAEFSYLAVTLYESLTGKTAVVGDASFSDTNYEYALKAKNSGIVNGYPDGTFRPDAYMTRAEIAKLFINVLEVSDIEIDTKSLKVFNDDYEIPLWAREAVYIAKAFNIVNGVGDNMFAPKGNATKEQALAMFYRIHQKYVVAGMDVLSAYEPLSIDKKAPEFKLKDLDGEDHELSSYRGKPVIVFFGTSYDHKSKTLLKLYNSMDKSKLDDFVILNVNITNQDDLESVKKVVDELDIKYPVLIDEDGKVLDKYSVSNRPYTFVIDSEGVIKALMLGSYDAERVEEFLKKVEK